MGGLYQGGMERYAAERYDEGKALQLAHQPVVDGGPCAACGRMMPCDGKQRGDELVDRYAAWVNPRRTSPLARPYVTEPVRTPPPRRRPDPDGTHHSGD